MLCIESSARFCACIVGLLATSYNRLHFSLLPKAKPYLSHRIFSSSPVFPKSTPLSRSLLLEFREFCFPLRSSRCTFSFKVSYPLAFIPSPRSWGVVRFPSDTLPYFVTHSSIPFHRLVVVDDFPRRSVACCLSLASQLPDHFPALNYRL